MNTINLVHYRNAEVAWAIHGTCTLHAQVVIMGRSINYDDIHKICATLCDGSLVEPDLVYVWLHETSVMVPGQ